MAIAERSTYISPGRLRLNLGVSEEPMTMFKRVQDLVSQSEGQPANLEKAFEAMARLYLEKKDPVQKAERSKIREVKKLETQEPVQKKPKSPLTGSLGVQPKIESSKSQFLRTVVIPSERSQTRDLSPRSRLDRDESPRTPIPSKIKDQVNLRDQSKCQYVLVTGKKCGSGRWLHYHHRKPVSKGGAHTVWNLVTLCSAHHQLIHQQGGLSETSQLTPLPFSTADL